MDHTTRSKVTKVHTKIKKIDGDVIAKVEGARKFCKSTHIES